MSQTTAQTARLPRQIPFIIGNEACERFSFYGMRNILVQFLITSLLLQELTADGRAGEATDIMSTTDDFGANDWLIEDMRERYRADPGSVPQQWAVFFQGEDAEKSTSASPQSAAATPVAPSWSGCHLASQWSHDISELQPPRCGRPVPAGQRSRFEQRWAFVDGCRGRKLRAAGRRGRL